MDIETLSKLIVDDELEAVSQAFRDDPALVHARFSGDIPDTPLHMAAQQVNARMVAEVLKWDPDVNAIGDGGRTPLHYAIEDSDEVLDDVFTLVQLLLEHGADPTIPDDYGLTPIHLCAIAAPIMPKTLAMLQEHLDKRSQ